MAVSFGQLFDTVVINGRTYKDLFENRFRINQKYLNDTAFYYEYEIADGDRIETVAYKALGKAEYWWIVALYNDLYDLFSDWPMTQKEIEATVANSMAEQALDDPTLSGPELDAIELEVLTELETEADVARKIKLPRADFIYDIIREIKKAVKS